MSRKFLVLSVIGVLLLGSTVLAYSEGSDYMAASFHGVIIADNEIDAHSYDEAINELDEALQNKMAEVVGISFDGQMFRFSPAELGVSFDTYETAEQAIDASMGMGFMKMFKKVDIDPVVVVDRAQLLESLGRIVPGINGPKDAKIMVVDGQVYISNHKDGHRVDIPHIESQVKAAMLGDEVEVMVEAEEAPAQYTTEMAKTDARQMSELFGKVLTLSYSTDFEAESIEVVLNPSWVRVKNGGLYFDEKKIADYLERTLSVVIDKPKQDAVILALPEVANRRATVEGVAKDGLELNIEQSVEKITEAISSGKDAVVLPIDVTRGEVLNKTGVDLGDLKWLATGRSNYAGSSAGRRGNISVGLDQKFNNVLLEPGGEFSLIANSDGPISASNGWYMAKIISGGKVVNGMGGGLCQTSTTIYRAALNAGLEIVKRKPHSLWVHYYKEHGAGLDAAVMNSAGLDYKHKNNTGNYLFMQSYTDGDDAFVHFYGTDDGRNVDMDGPYYGKENANPHPLLQGLRRNQVGWVQTITWGDGTVTQKPIISSYSSAVY